MMQPPTDEQIQDGTPTVKLNRIVTPAHIKIMSASMAPVEKPEVVEVPDAPEQELDEPEAADEIVAAQGMTALKKLGITAACLTALIIVLLIPWPQPNAVENPDLAKIENAPEPNPFLSVASLIAPAPRDVDVAEVARPITEGVLLLPSQPTIATAPTTERVPSVGEPAAELTVPVDVVVIAEPEPAIEVVIPDSHTVETEIEPTVIEEVVVVSAPVETIQVDTVRVEAGQVETGPVEAKTDDSPRDFVQQATFNAIAALRSEPKATVSSQDAAVFAFVADARAAGRTDVAVDALINAAHQARRLEVPAKYLRPDGRVNSAAVFSAMVVAE